VAGHYCGDSSIQTAYEGCDDGPANNIYGLCSPKCTTCARLAGWEPWNYDDTAWAGGLYFQVTKATTLYQFKVYNQGQYRIDLYKINDPSDWSNYTTVPWSLPSTPTGWFQPLNNPDTINLTLNLSVGTYMMVKTGNVMISDWGVASFPAVSPAGITVTGSLVCGDLIADQWWQGSVVTYYWSSFLDLRTCLQGI
jgi:hypothetical protein